MHDAMLSPDMRSWMSLPSKISAARFYAPEGVDTIEVHSYDDAGRKLATHIRLRRRVEAEAKKKSYIDKFIPHIGIALKEILGFSEKEEKRVVETLRKTLERSREHMV